MPGGRITLVARGRAQGAYAPGRKALREVRKLRKQVMDDPKWIAVTLDATPDTTGTVASIFPIAQGVDESERLGDKVSVMSILVKGSLIQNTSSTGGTRVRFVLIQDRKGSTTVPTIVQTYGTVARFTNNLPRLFGSLEMDRWKVILDKYFILPLAADNQAQKQFNYFKRFKNPLSVTFSGTAGTDESCNHVYAMIASNEGTNVPAGNWEAVSKFFG